MAILRPSTELEAVNSMLGSIGQSPVSTLTDPGLVDAVIAKAILDETSRDLQMQGWWFNTELDYSIAPDVDGFLQVPVNTLRIDPTLEFNHLHLTWRGGRMYNLKDHTYVFTAPVKFSMTLGLDFADLPEVARRVIIVQAARTFQDRVLASDTIHAYTQEDELRVRAELERAENDHAGHNYFAGADMQRTISRLSIIRYN